MSSIAEKPNINIETLFAEYASSASGAAASPRRFELIATAAEICGDALAAGLAMCVAYGVYHLLGLGKHVLYPTPVVLSGALVFAMLFVLMLDRDGAYHEGNGLLRVRETERALRVSTETLLLILPVTFFSAHLPSRWVLCLAFAFVPAFVIVEKQLFFILIRALHLRGRGLRKVLIYGAGLTGKRVFSALVRSPKLGLEPVAIIDDAEQKAGEEVYAFDYRRERCLRVSLGPVDAQTIRDFGADIVVVAIPTIGREKFLALAAATVETGAKLSFVPGRSISSDWVDYADIDGLMLASFGAAKPQTLYEMSKRIFDRVATIAILAVSAPLLAVIAVAVHMDSPGPVLFKQRRVGRYGKLFDIYKFRSMRVDAPKYGFSPKESDDPRITRVGRFLRKTSLDELPQLLNVLKGDMSLVGPRPEMPFIAEQYGPRERQRLSVLPGLTGLWQLSADRAFLIHENILYDLYYIRNRGFFMDLAILMHTAVFAMKGV